jgi:hypothetical protein
MINKNKEGIETGEIVLYRFPEVFTPPAIIVNDLSTGEGFDNGEVNLHVFTDFVNDGKNVSEWATVVPYSADPKPNTWSWPDGHVIEAADAEDKSGGVKESSLP